MKTPAELINDLKGQLEPMENDYLSIIQYAGLLSVLTAGPDAETAIDGIHRLMFEIRDHAAAIGKQHEAIWRIVKCLDDPEGDRCA
jgi:hypothetical protein